MLKGGFQNIDKILNEAREIAKNIQKQDVIAPIVMFIKNVNELNETDTLKISVMPPVKSSRNKRV